MDQPGASGSAVRFAPVREPGHGRACGACQSHTHRERRRAPHPWVAVRRDIECQGRRPCADRHVGEHWVKRMAQPHAVQGVLGLSTGWPAASYAARTALLNGSATRSIAGLSHGLHQRVGAFHQILLTQQRLNCRTMVRRGRLTAAAPKPSANAVTMAAVARGCKAARVYTLLLRV